MDAGSLCPRDKANETAGWLNVEDEFFLLADREASVGIPILE